MGIEGLKWIEIEQDYKTREERRAEREKELEKDPEWVKANEFWKAEFEKFRKENEELK